MSSVVAGLQRNRKESAPRDREGCDANRAGWSLGHDQQRFLFDLCDSGSAGSGGGTGRVVAVVFGANCMFAGVCSLGSAHLQDPQSGSSIVTHVGGWLFFLHSLCLQGILHIVSLVSSLSSSLPVLQVRGRGLGRFVPSFPVFTEELASRLRRLVHGCHSHPR